MLGAFLFCVPLETHFSELLDNRHAADLHGTDGME